MNVDALEKLEAARRSVADGYELACKHYGHSDFLLSLFGDMAGHLNEAVDAIVSASRESRDTPSEDLIALSRAFGQLLEGTLASRQKWAATRIAVQAMWDSTLPASDDDDHAAAAST
jgi:hypothetical protein